MFYDQHFTENDILCRDGQDPNFNLWFYDETIFYDDYTQIIEIGTCFKKC